MTGKQLTEYFRHVMELESSIRCQEQIREKIKNISPQYPPQPEYRTSNKTSNLLHSKYQLECPNDESKDLLEPTKPTLAAYMILIAIFGVIAALIVLIIAPLNYFFPIWLVGFGIFAIPFLIKYAIDRVNYEKAMEYYYSEFDRRRDDYKKKKAEYDAKKQEFDRQIKDADQIVHSNHQKAQSSWMERKNEIDRAVRQAKLEADRLTGPIAEARNSLQQLYDKNVIYPKYRNMVAVCTIYEYLESGRCSALDGPNGAYNLYESELRQNLIINKLDEVIDNIAIIQNNQFQLYKKLDAIETSMKNLDKSLKEIASGVSIIGTTTLEIAQSSKITALSSIVTAQCATITAQNTEAMKYIALIN